MISGLQLGDFAASLSAQADAIEAGDITPGLRAIAVAARHPELQRALFRHVARGERFLDATPYGPQASGDGSHLVLFSFVPAPPDGDAGAPAVAAYLDPAGGRLLSVADGAPSNVRTARAPLAMTDTTLFAIGIPPKDPTNTGNATWSGREGRQTQDDFADKD